MSSPPLSSNTCGFETPQAATQELKPVPMSLPTWRLSKLT